MNSWLGYKLFIEASNRNDGNKLAAKIQFALLREALLEHDKARVLTGYNEYVVSSFKMYLQQ